MKEEIQKEPRLVIKPVTYDQVVYAVKHDGVIVYIGSGTRGREKHGCSGISHVYELNKLHFSGANLSVELLMEGLSKKIAIEEERNLIIQYKPIYNTRFLKERQCTKGRETKDLIDNLFHNIVVLGLEYGFNNGSILKMVTALEYMIRRHGFLNIVDGLSKKVVLPHKRVPFIGKYGSDRSPISDFFWSLFLDGDMIKFPVDMYTKKFKQYGNDHCV